MPLLHAENNNNNNNKQHMTELPTITTTDNSSAMAIRAPSSLSPTTTSDDQSSYNNHNNNNNEQQNNNLEQHHEEHEEEEREEEEGEDDDDDDEQKLSLDRVHLTLLLVSGNRHTFELDPSSTVAQVKKQVITEWPEDWEASRTAPSSVGSIELLYLGKFLDNDSTLESNRLRGGESFTVHLLVRDQQLKSAEDTKTTEVPRCKCCIIL